MSFFGELKKNTFPNCSKRYDLNTVIANLEKYSIRLETISFTKVINQSINLSL